ncbi:MAG: GGDEF domain-containing protein [Xanthobacteraceae bacterium]|nr:GGDEF domain-containing protein [Xanthobacteraceae bacterium]
MDLDVKTMFVVTISVTSILGLLLIFAWYQQRKIQALAWWGCAHLIASVAVWMIGARGTFSDLWSIDIANSLLFVSSGMIWTGARLFDGNRVSLVGVFGGAAAWLMAGQITGFMDTPDGPVIFSSMIIACYTFGTAIEFWRGRGDQLMSRLPLIVMLSMHGILYLVRIPLTLAMPNSANGPVFSAAWFGVIGLESLLYMIATAFILLAMAKERSELEHKTAAMIDPLTGIANRRAFLDAAARRMKQRTREPQPVSALLFDLDRFKDINDQYGHPVGDRVLQIFTDTAASELRSSDLLGRLGGEEFAAILFGAEAGSAAATAERVRSAFVEANAVLDGYEVGTSVSVGVASVPADEVTGIEELLTRADEALYVAKARGRNRVEVADAYTNRVRQAPRGEWRPSRSSEQRADPRLVAASLGLVASPAVAPEDERAGDGLRRNPLANPASS